MTEENGNPPPPGPREPPPTPHHPEAVDRAHHPDLTVRPFRVLGLAREGIPIILVIAGGSLLLSILAVILFGRAGSWAAAVLIAITMWSVWFFRDPDRAPPTERGIFLAPADGIVASVVRAPPPEELELPPEYAAGLTRISIFMNVFNVHVNRSPVDGRILRLRYRPGRFINASLDKASKHNERCSMLLETPDERQIVVVQIAGLVARRIVSRVQEGQYLLAGERFGMIRFGSRLDVYVPEDVTPIVRVGEKTVAGRTIIARLDPAAAAPSVPPGAPGRQADGGAAPDPAAARRA